MDLNVDCVNALLHIIPGEELLVLAESFSSLLDKSVCIPDGESQGKVQHNITTTQQFTCVTVTSDLQWSAARQTNFSCNLFNLIKCIGAKAYQCLCLVLCTAIALFTVIIIAGRYHTV